MSEWKKCKLGSITSKIGSGATPRGGENSYKTAGISLIRSQNVYNFIFSIDGLAYIDDKQAYELRNVEVFENDILINITGESVTRTCIVPKQILPARVNQHVSIIRPIEEKADFKFVFYSLQSIKPELHTMAEIGCTRRALTKGMLENLDIILPPLPEQLAIASVLSSLDDKIDLLHRQNKTLEAMAETLFRQGFVEEADEGWEEGKIPDEFDFTMGLSPSGESYNEEEIGIPMYQGNADFEFRFPKRRVFTTDPKRFAEQFDTLISVRAPVGAQNMANERCCIGRGVAAFIYKRNNCYYTYTYFKMKSLMKEIDQFNQTGTVFGSISKADFEALEIVLPPTEIVYNFQSGVKPIDDKVMNNCFQIRTLEKLRDMLLPKLISGQIRIKNLENFDGVIN
ncbi:Type-1 restriction enzyme MjaXIP specificity protein [ANME-1 cluster archaeon GoMg1]|nr:Type-1 restriction enzyme MjaXIP specificity protein [ANME-1 cluster archaeon GoMg1]